MAIRLFGKNTTTTTDSDNESFESGFGNWYPSDDNDEDWERNSGSTGSSNTGPSSAHDGNYYAYCECSGPSEGDMFGLEYDLGGEGSSISLSFYYHMYGDTMGTLSVESWDGSSWNEEWSLSGDQGDSWNSKTVSISSAEKVRFKFLRGSDWASDAAIDDVQLSYEVTKVDDPKVSKAMLGNQELYGIALGSMMLWGGYEPYVYTASSDDSFHKIKLDGTKVWEYLEHTDAVFGVDIDKDNYVYTASQDEEVHKVDPNGNNVWKYTEHTYFVHDVSVNADGYIYTASGDTDVHKVDPNGNNVWKYTEHGDDVYGINIDKDGYIYTTSFDNSVHKIDPDGTNVWKYTEHTESVYNVSIDTDDGYFYTVSADDTMHKVELDGTKVWEYTGHTDAVRSVVVSADGYVYTGARDEEVHKVDPNGNNVWKYTEHGRVIYGMDIDEDGYIYTASYDQSAHKIDPDGNNVWKYTEHVGFLQDISITPKK